MHRLITEHALRKVCEPTPVWQMVSPRRGMALAPGRWQPSDEAVVLEKTVTCAGTLRFVLGGASGELRVWLDERLLGAAAPGETLAALAEDVPYAAHLLRVEVSPAPNGGPGYLRTVTVEQLGSALVTALTVTPRRKGRLWLADMRVTVRSLCDSPQSFDLEATAGPAHAQWKHRLLPPRGEVTLGALTPAPGVTPWSPEKPRLYAAEAVLWLDGTPADDLRDRVGFREAAMGEDGFRLNGEALALRGLRAAPAFTLEEMLARVQSALDAGVNLLCPEGPVDSRLLDLCDQAGILVLTDDPGGHPCQAPRGALPKGIVDLMAEGGDQGG